MDPIERVRHEKIVIHAFVFFHARLAGQIGHGGGEKGVDHK
jgi:hypothetical protein